MSVLEPGVSLHQLLCSTWIESPPPRFYLFIRDGDRKSMYKQGEGQRDKLSSSWAGNLTRGLVDSRTLRPWPRGEGRCLTNDTAPVSLELRSSSSFEQTCKVHSKGSVSAPALIRKSASFSYTQQSARNRKSNSNWLQLQEGFIDSCHWRSLRIGWTLGTVPLVLWCCSFAAFCEFFPPLGHAPYAGEKVPDLTSV